jgi:surface polysaccharide O-acyltransferase-like enzyme
MVLMYHALTEPYSLSLVATSQQYSMIWLSQTFYNALVIMGVPLFVILSGALLLQPSKANEPIKVFFKKRLARIGLAFAFWSAVYLAWSYFADAQVLTFKSVVQMLLSGGVYYQFWYIYLIVGLYLLTPVLRILVAHSDRGLLRYLIVLWFVAAAGVPLFHLITGLTVDSNLFLLAGYVGYFILGFYLMGANVQNRLWKALLVVGVVWTIVGTWLMAYPFHYIGQYYFFLDTISANVILASIGAYMLLSKRPVDWPGKNHPRLSRLIHTISVNTLPIYFLHVIIIESVYRGYFQLFKISLLKISFFGYNLTPGIFNPIIEIPLAAIVTLFICLGLILLMKKVPVLKQLIG